MLYTIKVFYVSNKTLMLPNDKEKSVTISHNSSDAHTTGARSVTRRNLTRGALWAVPAIAASTRYPHSLPRLMIARRYTARTSPRSAAG